jgi:PAS domain S-box-containing protein
VNPRFCEITGYSEAELLGRHFQTITHQEDMPTNLDLYRRLQAGEFPSYHMEKRYIRPDGQIVWTELTGAVVRDAAGTPQYGVAVIQDITARKEAEARLRESEARLAAVLQQLPIAVGLIDTEGYLVVSNARMRAFVPARIPVVIQDIDALKRAEAALPSPVGRGSVSTWRRRLSRRTAGRQRSRALSARVRRLS